MQIKGSHKNIYKLSAYALSQEKLETHRKKYEKQVRYWKKLKSEDVSTPICQEVVGMSRATFYRYRRHLNNLEKGILPPSKKPKTLRKASWGEAEIQLVLRLRRETLPMEKLRLP